MLDEEYIVWLDGEGTAHLTDECTDFVGSWKLITAETAIEDGAVACMNCEADLYLAALAVDQQITIERPAEPTPEPTEAPTPEPTAEPTEAPTEEPTAEPAQAASVEETEAPAAEAPAETASTEEESEIKVTHMPELVSGEPTETPTEEPTAAPTEAPTEVPTEEPTAEPTEAPTEEPTTEPTAEPTEKPTPEPTPEVVVPATALKSAGRAMLYVGDDSAVYHLKADCTALTGSSRVSEFEDCVLTMQPCGECGAPAAELADLPCLWKDENDLCHTADTCASFQGAWTLISRDEALAATLLPCSECGADEYLLPGTEIDYAAIVTPTPIPTATPNPNAFVYTDILVVDAA